MALRYDDYRDDSYSTLGDAAEWFRRDRASFRAGAQYALDRLVSKNGVLNVLGDQARLLAEDQAAAILLNVSRGEL